MDSPPAMLSAEQLLCALRRTPPPQGGGGAPSAIIDRFQEWRNMGESVVKGLVDSFSDIESREDNLRSVSASIEMQLGELKAKEMELKLLHEGKRAALKLREDELRSREEKLDEQLRLVDEHIGKLEASQSELDRLRVKELERLKEIEKREREFKKRLEEFEKTEREFKKRLEEFDKREREFKKRLEEFEKREMELENQLEEYEKREKEFEGKSRELALKDEVLGKEKAGLVEEVRLANEKIKEKQKLGYELIGRLELAVNMLGGMKVIIDERFKEIESREALSHESLSAKLKEAELIRESLEIRFKELEEFEKEHNFSQEDKTKEIEQKEGQIGTVGINEVELRGEKSTEQQQSGLRLLENKLEEKKKQELELKQANVLSCKKEYDNEEHDSREKSLSCVRESAQTCTEENLALSKLDQAQRPSVGTDVRLVADNAQRVCGPREVDLNRELHDVHSKEQGSKQPMLTGTTDACLTTKQDEPVDSKHALNKNLLVQLINDPGRDLELTGPWMYKILSLSSDPAKLVVEAFNELSSGIYDKERRATVLLLDQLTKLSPKIQPCVSQAAFELADRWKQEITIAQNPLEALAFLQIVSAYNLSSHFGENELFSYIKMAAKHKHTPDLCRTLGLLEKIPGYIEELIYEKQYLLASSYICEYQLQHMFPQATILNYYAAHSKKSANEKGRSEHNSPAAQEKAIATEIAALRLAIEHIIKYKLESDYSPNALTARINQLEASQASFRRGIPSPSPNMQKQGRHNGPQQLSRRARKKLRQEAMKSNTFVLNPGTAPREGSNKWYSPTWRLPPQHQSSQTETCLPPPPLPPPPYRRAPVNLVPMHHPVGPQTPQKRPRTDTWMNHGGLQGGQFANQC